jgi:hypothetical protein
MTTHKLEYPDGTPADPPTYLSATGTAWNLGDPLYIGRRTLRVIATRLDEGDGDPVPLLVVEPV